MGKINPEQIFIKRAKEVPLVNFFRERQAILQEFHRRDIFEYKLWFYTRFLRLVLRVAVISFSFVPAAPRKGDSSRQSGGRDFSGAEIMWFTECRPSPTTSHVLRSALRTVHTKLVHSFPNAIENSACIGVSINDYLSRVSCGTTVSQLGVVHVILERTEGRDKRRLLGSSCYIALVRKAVRFLGSLFEALSGAWLLLEFAALCFWLTNERHSARGIHVIVSCHCCTFYLSHQVVMAQELYGPRCPLERILCNSEETWTCPHGNITRMFQALREDGES